jgi:hypothetical protein
MTMRVARSITVARYSQLSPVLHRRHRQARFRVAIDQRLFSELAGEDRGEEIAEVGHGRLHRSRMVTRR